MREGTNARVKLGDDSVWSNPSDTVSPGLREPEVAIGPKRDTERPSDDRVDRPVLGDHSRRGYLANTVIVLCEP